MDFLKVLIPSATPLAISGILFAPKKKRMTTAMNTISIGFRPNISPPEENVLSIQGLQ
jgi:hypothetical protein